MTRWGALAVLGAARFLMVLTWRYVFATMFATSVSGSARQQVPGEPQPAVAPAST